MARTMAKMPNARFMIGEVVRHRVFGYRGLVCDVDPEYDSEASFDEIFAGRQECLPRRDRPWYHVLVDGAEFVTYVAEEQLEPAADADGPIDHPLIREFFRERPDGAYRARTAIN